MNQYAVRLVRDGPLDWSRDLREQQGWDEHARSMDALVAEGLILLGGPLAGDRDVLHGRFQNADHHSPYSARAMPQDALRSEPMHPKSTVQE